MRVSFSRCGVEKLIDLTVNNWQMTLSELYCEVFGQKPNGLLWVDSRQLRVDTTLHDAKIMEGTIVSDDEPVVIESTNDWILRVSAGPDVSFPRILRPGVVLTIGRSPQADIVIESPMTSWAHATVAVAGSRVRIIDLDSSNGTFIGDQQITSEGVLVDHNCTVVVGGTAIALSKGLAEPASPVPGSLPNLTPARTAPFNRPPRPGAVAGSKPVVPPTHQDPTKPSRFSWAAILSPLIMAVAMVMIMQNLRFALFALLSPIIGIATWAENNRRFKRDTEKEKERYAKALADFQEELSNVADVERARLEEAAPDPGRVIMRALLPSTRLWQRRFGAFDYLNLYCGIGNLDWEPPIDASGVAKLDSQVQEVIDGAQIENAPVSIDLDNAGVVGIFGQRQGALALARSLTVQAAVHIGPADLGIGFFTESSRSDAWEWAGWLPHTQMNNGSSASQWLGFKRRRSDQLLSMLRDSVDSQLVSSFLIVVDSEVLLEGRESTVRKLLGHGRYQVGESNRRKGETQVSGIVIAETEDQLPASCTSVIEIHEDFTATVRHPETRTRIEGVMYSGISQDKATIVARTLAKFDDPEVRVPGASLPSMVSMLPLLGLEDLSAQAIRKLWKSNHQYSTPVGISEKGTYSLDIIHDGPHGLVGGTTGSGKSEFLRTLVAGLAARVDPEHLTFILIDFKGGAAFAACNVLPHTIGTISNLDQQLANRALRALEAEMKYRQEAFARAGEGVDNLDAYLATNPAEPMPRILVVIDEFAQLAKEFPDVLSALVSVGAVGRTLGIHMILATQRPAGVVNDDILANTNMRVALRVQSREDSSNVIGVPDASAISREQRGRAYVKLGEDDIAPIQTALITGYSDVEEEQAVELKEIVFGTDTPLRRSPHRSSSDENDLDKLIQAICAANEVAGFRPPRPVWPEPLGESVSLVLSESDASLGNSQCLSGEMNNHKILVGLSDDPDHQRQIRDGWNLDEGNLLLMGIPGSGTTTALTSIALTAADSLSPEELDLFVLDMGGSAALKELQSLPHMAGFAGTGQGSDELRARLIKYLRKELDRRKVDSSLRRKIILLLDGLATLRDEYQDADGMDLLDQLYRVYADGPSVGIHCVATTTRAKAVPSAIDDVTTQKWLFKLADPYDYSLVGIRPADAPPAVPGRCVIAGTKLHTHIATPPQGLTESVIRVSGRYKSMRKPSVIALLPSRVSVSEVQGIGTIVGDPWKIPIGIAEYDLNPVALELYQGEHMLIAGPVRSGKSSVLLGIAQSLREIAQHDCPSLEIWGLGSRRSPICQASLDRVASEEEAAELLAALRLQQVPTVLLIDDAERFDDADGAINRLLNANLPDLRVIAAGRADDLRTSYNHWTKTIRRSRCGILLQPNIDYDGDLLSVRLPRRTPVEMTTGRAFAGYGGQVILVQCATANIA